MPTRSCWRSGAANLAVGLGQGFPVTGADLRTAVNDAMGGRTQLVGIVAAGAMLLVLLALTAPLALVPTTALAAVILVSAAGLFDIAGLRLLLAMSRREGLMSIATTSACWCWACCRASSSPSCCRCSGSWPPPCAPRTPSWGGCPDFSGFHSIADYPQAETIPGLLLYRFSANLLFFNIDYFCERVRAAIRDAAPPVAWVVVDLSPTSLVDATAVQRFDELREELAARGVDLGDGARRNASSAAGSRCDGWRSAAPAGWSSLSRPFAPPSRRSRKQGRPGSSERQSR